MTLALDPQKDILIPVPVLKRFATANHFEEYEEMVGEIRTALTDESSISEEQIGKDAKYSFLREDTNEYKTLQTNFKTLSDNINKFPDAQQARLVACFLFPFGGKVTEPAKIIWEALGTASDNYSLKNVETEANKYRQQRQQAFTTLAKSCKTFQESVSGITQKLSVFTQALAAGGAPGGAGGVVAESKNLNSVKKQYMLDKKLYENRLIDRSEYLASLAKTKNILLEAKNTVVVDTPTMVFNAPTNIDDQKRKVVNRFKVTKKLYEQGLLTRSEYMASLLEVRNILTEVDRPLPPRVPRATGTAAAPAARVSLPLPAPRPRRPATATGAGTGTVTGAGTGAGTGAVTGTDTGTDTGTGAGTVTGAGTGAGTVTGAGTAPAETEKTKIRNWAQGVQQSLQPIGTLAVSLQEGLTKINQTLTTESKKEPLNEIFISLILGALAAVAAWFTAKWAAKNFGGYLDERPSGRIRPGYVVVAPPNEQQNAAGNFLNGLNAGLGPNGQLIGDDGRQVADINAIIQMIEESLKNGASNIQKLTTEAQTILTNEVATNVGATSNQEAINNSAMDLLQTFNAANLTGQIQGMLQQIDAIKQLS